MGELSDIAMSAISQAQSRVEIAAQNLSNAATPSYKRRIAFSTLVEKDKANRNSIPQVNLAIDQRPGKLIETGNPANLALTGPGFFALRLDGQTIYSRNGQFSIDGEGRLVDKNGFALQLRNGRDLVVKSDVFEIGFDGVVQDKGEVLGTIAVFSAGIDGTNIIETLPENTTAAGAALIESPAIKQGMIEASNVTTGDEMVVMMEALKRAEAGQRIMTVYDDLMGRAITSFGDGTR
jgi:flagellar basal-body rod protein FlgF